MFERFTASAIMTIMLAQEEAGRLKHDFVGPEMLLLGMLNERTSIAGRALRESGVTLKDVRVEAEKIHGVGEVIRPPVEFEFTSAGKQVLELAWMEAQEFSHNYIGAEHILLGLLRETKNKAECKEEYDCIARILKSLAVDVSVLRKKVLQLLPNSGTENVETKQNKRSSEERESFQDFTEDAIRSIELAKEEANKSGHDFVGSEHLLLGLLGEGTGVAARVLKDQGMSLKETRCAVANLIGVSTGVSGKFSLSPRTLKVITLARTQAKKLGHAEVSGAHLLLGIIESGAGAAHTVMEGFKIDLNELRQTVLDQLF